MSVYVRLNSISLQYYYHYIPTRPKLIARRYDDNTVYIWYDYDASHVNTIPMSVYLSGPGSIRDIGTLIYVVHCLKVSLKSPLC